MLRDDWQGTAKQITEVTSWVFYIPFCGKFARKIRRWNPLQRNGSVGRARW